MPEEKIEKSLSGRAVFAMFAAFFLVVVGVNAIYITTALDTHSGVVTENYYQEGLRYNEILEKAKNQPDVKSAVRFENGTLSWKLAGMDGRPIDNAEVRATFIRPVKQGSDFESALIPVASGLYSLTPDFPAPGNWIVKLDAQWDNKQFQTKQNLIVE